MTGIATTDNNHTTTAVNARDGTAGYAQHGRKAAGARLGNNSSTGRCGKTARLMHGPKKKSLLTLWLARSVTTPALPTRAPHDRMMKEAWNTRARTPKGPEDPLLKQARPGRVGYVVLFIELPPSGGHHRSSPDLNH